MRPTDFDIQTVIDSVQGTCDTINDHLPEGMNDMDLTLEDHNSIDNQIFQCDECGWWYEQCQNAGDADDGKCEDCVENV